MPNKSHTCMPARILIPFSERAVPNAPATGRLAAGFQWLMSAANRRMRALAWVAWGLALVPGARLAWDAYRGQLGANPLEQVLRTPGRYALILLIVVLAATPLRRLTAFVLTHIQTRYGRRPADWNWLIHLRRPLGLAAFFYALVHATLYVSLDLDFRWAELAADVRQKPFVLAGLAALLLLVPLALTSSDHSIRRLKRNWYRLHTLVYPAAALAALHFILLTKPGIPDPYVYAGVLAALLGYRAIAACLRAYQPSAAPVKHADATAATVRMPTAALDGTAAVPVAERRVAAVE